MEESVWRWLAKSTAIKISIILDLCRARLLPNPLAVTVGEEKYGGEMCIIRENLRGEYSDCLAMI